MKMKKIYSLSMAALCIMSWAALNTACTSEEPVASGKAGYFEATATLPGNAVTRVAFTEAADGSKITPAWEAGDKIYVMQADAPATNAFLTIAGVPAAGENAVFSGSFAPETNKTLQAFYGGCEITNDDSGTYFVSNFDVQDGTLASASAKAMMYAQCTYDGSTPNFAFKNICSILKVVATLPEAVQHVKSLSVKCPDNYSFVKSGIFYEGEKYQMDNYEGCDMTVNWEETGIVPDENHTVTVYLVTFPLLFDLSNGDIASFNLKDCTVSAIDDSDLSYSGTITADQEVAPGGMYTVNQILTKNQIKSLALPALSDDKEGFKAKWTAEDAREVMVLPVEKEGDHLDLSRSLQISNISEDMQKADFTFQPQDNNCLFFYPYTDKHSDATLAGTGTSPSCKYRLPKYDFSNQKGSTEYISSHAPMFLAGENSKQLVGVVKLNLNFKGMFGFASSNVVTNVVISLKDSDGKELLPASFTVSPGVGSPFVFGDYGACGPLKAELDIHHAFVNESTITPGDGVLTVYFMILVSYRNSLNSDASEVYVNTDASETLGDLDGMLVTVHVATGSSSGADYSGTVSKTGTFSTLLNTGETSSKDVEMTKKE